MEDNKYDHRKVEKHWQSVWEKEGLYFPDLSNTKKKFYNLWMFPYPSAEGLHAGHAFASTGSDVYGRFMRMNDWNVFQPIGYDSFGIHSENYAIKINDHPAKMIERTTKHYEAQMRSLGHAYDWTRTVTTSDSDYYRWTQWIFLQMFKAGLAYKKKAKVNWCPSCKTVLADEQVVTPAQAGKEPLNSKGEVIINDAGLPADWRVCERCGTIVERKDLEQWFFRITDYADKLLDGLDKIKWPEKIKTAQRNWIGKKEGAEIKFQILLRQSSGLVNTPPTKLRADKQQIDVFTTRPDTLYGATFLVVSPTYAQNYLLKYISADKIDTVTKYINTSFDQSSSKRSDLSYKYKEKSGIDSGLKAINPATQKEIPIYISDYVLDEYGTGAIMGVPAHDERDFAFAKKYKLLITDVITPVFGEANKTAEFRKTISAVVKRKSDDKYLIVKWKKFGWIAPVVGGIENGEDALETAEREVLEETGYKVKAVRKLGGVIESNFYAENKKVWRKREDQPVLLEFIDESPGEVTEDEKKHEIMWLSYDEAMSSITHEYNKTGFQRYVLGSDVYTGEGKLVNSGDWNGLRYPKDFTKILSDIERRGWGAKKLQYHLRDWLISRQRYWGPPIPMIYCGVCAKEGKSFFTENLSSGNAGNFADWSSMGYYPVPESELPVTLPEISDFKPEGSGKGPLAKHPEFFKTKCPGCGGEAVRETDVSDTFLDSAWYFLRYPSVKKQKSNINNQNDKSKIENKMENIPWDPKITRNWLPVDLYFGGAEHAVLHLMYARFVWKMLVDNGFVDKKLGYEPFPWFYAHGLMIKDGAKMSKSRGNVVNPDEYIEKFGADTLRLYLMFMGPMDGYPDFRDTGIEGMRKFVERVWTLFESHSQFRAKKVQQFNNLTIQQLLIKQHQTIKKVTEDIQEFKYNTAISAIMEYVNVLKVQTQLVTNNLLPVTYIETLALLLAPFTPHLAEEVWQSLREGEIRTDKKADLHGSGLRKSLSVHTHAWPSYDPKLIVEQTLTIAVQVNGKLRSTITIDREKAEDKEYVSKLAQSDTKISKWVVDKKILKEIYITGRLVNFIV